MTINSKMDPLLEALIDRIDELHSSAMFLRDDRLIEYLTGEVQHLINKVDHNMELDAAEEAELKQRNDTVELFKLFYTWLIANGKCG